MKYYKFIDENNRGPYSDFDFTKYLPADDKPGHWLPEVDGELELCERGYHACTAHYLLDWCDAQLYEVEYMTEPEHGDNKVNGSCIRFIRKVDTWNERNARLFAVWCAREALKSVGDPYQRSIDAVNVAERYAMGNATDKELDAARSAARYAAWDAAWAAARCAALCAAWDAAQSAARDAVRCAARSAARYAAWDAARSAARCAQYEKLYEILEIPHD